MNQHLIVDAFLNVAITYLTNYWWILFAIIILSFTRTPFFKGWLGEQIVKYISRTQLKQPDYNVIHNVTLEMGQGTTQIDHIIISKYGLFVVETKNYSGWIFGNDKQATWTQVLFKQKYKFQNPLIQNYKHAKAIESALQIDSTYIHSVIVFMGGATFKTSMPPQVCYANNYAEYIKSLTKEVFSKEQVEDLIITLSSKRLKPGYSTNKRHLNHLKKRT